MGSAPLKPVKEEGGHSLVILRSMRIDKFVAATIELMVTLGSALYYLNVWHLSILYILSMFSYSDTF